MAGTENAGSSSCSGGFEGLVVADAHGQDRYLLEGLLHAGGGEGRVFLASDARTRDPVALKQFQMDLGARSPGRDLGARLADLRSLSLQMQSIPGLVRYLEPFEGRVVGAPDLEIGQHVGWYLPMEFVKGPDVSTLIHHGLDGDGRRDLVVDLGGIARTLERLADAKPVPLAHRDVKPANIVIRLSEGFREAVLVDVGLMARADRLHLSTYGSNGYLAPELADGRVVRRDALHFADWYSFTATLYAVVAGADPPAAPERWRSDLEARRVDDRVISILVEAGTAMPSDRPRPTTLVRDLVQSLDTAHEPRPASALRRRLAIAAVLVAVLGGGAAAVIAASSGAAVSSLNGRALPSSSVALPRGSQGSAKARAAMGGPEAAEAVIAGGNHSCIVRADASAWCWGANQEGQLGDGTRIDHAKPARVADLQGVKQLVIGGAHTCALETDATVACWGANDQGQLGDGTTKNAIRPHLVPGLTGVTALGAGGGKTCAVAAMGSLYCWGVVVPSTSDPPKFNTTPRLVPGVPPVVSVAVGGGHVCAATSAGVLWCWGFNGWGQVGDGTVKNRFQPAAVTGLPKVTAVAASDAKTCALAEGAAYCWGDETFGQAQTGNDTLVLAPKLVGQLYGVEQISVADTHVCALGSGGYLYCWGANTQGQLGDGTTTDNFLVSRLRDFHTAVSVSAAGNNTCAVRADGSTWCWGANEFGQVGQDLKVRFLLSPQEVSAS